MSTELPLSGALEKALVNVMELIVEQKLAEWLSNNMDIYAVLQRVFESSEFEDAVTRIAQNVVAASDVGVNDDEIRQIVRQVLRDDVVVTVELE